MVLSDFLGQEFKIKIFYNSDSLGVMLSELIFITYHFSANI